MVSISLSLMFTFLLPHCVCFLKSSERYQQLLQQQGRGIMFTLKAPIILRPNKLDLFHNVKYLLGSENYQPAVEMAGRTFPVLSGG